MEGSLQSLQCYDQVNSDNNIHISLKTLELSVVVVSRISVSYVKYI